MSRSKEIALVAISITAFVLFNDPFLSIFNQPSFQWGIPVLYVSFFVIWILIIGCTFWIVRKTEKEQEDE